MPRASAVFSDVATEKKELAAFWAWPILVVAFIISGAIQLLLGFIGLFRRSPK